MATPNPLVDDSAADREAGYAAALDRLPAAYATALRCAASGLPDLEICARLDIELESLEPLLDLARRKLRRELTRA